MKSQPEVRIRRIAVFTGYGEDAFGTAFTRPVRRPVGRNDPAVIPFAARRRPTPATSPVPDRRLPCAA
jgi:hypothetical protein